MSGSVQLTFRNNNEVIAFCKDQNSYSFDKFVLIYPKKLIYFNFETKSLGINSKNIVFCAKILTVWDMPGLTKTADIIPE